MEWVKKEIFVSILVNKSPAGNDVFYQSCDLSTQPNGSKIPSPLWKAHRWQPSRLCSKGNSCRNSANEFRNEQSEDRLATGDALSFSSILCMTFPMHSMKERKGKEKACARRRVAAVFISVSSTIELSRCPGPKGCVRDLRGNGHARPRR